MASELYLTEYERERQKKIEENKRLLETLGIFETRSVLDASSALVETPKTKRNYIKRPRPLEPRRSERVSATSYAESDESGTESDKPSKSKNGNGIRKLNSYFSVRKTMWKPFYGQEIATCHICLVRNRQPKTKCSRCYADFWRGHVCRGCYEANFTGEDIESFDEARENPNWICFVCRGICTCKFCRVGSTKRGKRYTKKRPMEEEEALALAQGQQLQIKEEQDSDDGQNYLPGRSRRGRGRPPKSLSNSMLLGSDPGDEDDQFDHPLFEGQLDHHYHQFDQIDQLEQLEQLQEQLNHLEQLDQLEQLELQEREQERLRQDQLALVGGDPILSGLSTHHLVPGHIASGQSQPKRGRGRPPKNPQQPNQSSPYKRPKYPKHDSMGQKHSAQKSRQNRHKAHEYSDVMEGIPRYDMKHDTIQVKQEPLLDDSLLSHDPSLFENHMLLLSEQPMLHEHILNDIPPFQEHLQLPMMHGQSLQDMSQGHDVQEQLYRDHPSSSSYQQPFQNSFLHQNTHTHGSHTSTTTSSTSHGLTSYNMNNNINNHSFGAHNNGHFTNNHHGHHPSSVNGILNTMAPTSLLLDSNMYAHSYLFQHYYYPQALHTDVNVNSQQQHEIQQQQLMQGQQQQIEMHRQELQRQRQELYRQQQQHQQQLQQQQQQQLQQQQQQQEDDEIARQHELRQFPSPIHASISNPHHILHQDFGDQDVEPEENCHDTNNNNNGSIHHRDFASILQDPQIVEDEYPQQSSDHFHLAQPYERESSANGNYVQEEDYLANIHENDHPTTPPPSSSASLNQIMNGHHEIMDLQQLKQEPMSHDIQQREHYLDPLLNH